MSDIDRQVVQAYDPEPGRYCCLHPDCIHERDQVFDGGGGRDV